MKIKLLMVNEHKNINGIAFHCFTKLLDLCTKKKIGHQYIYSFILSHVSSVALGIKMLLSSSVNHFGPN